MERRNVGKAIKNSKTSKIIEIGENLHFVFKGIIETISPTKEINFFLLKDEIEILVSSETNLFLKSELSIKKVFYPKKEHKIVETFFCEITNLY